MHLGSVRPQGPNLSALNLPLAPRMSQQVPASGVHCDTCPGSGERLLQDIKKHPSRAGGSARLQPGARVTQSQPSWLVTQNPSLGNSWCWELGGGVPVLS